MLEKDLFAGIVTSLSFYNEEVLVVGHGPFLKLYNAITGKLLSCKEVLPNNRIHRIAFGKYALYTMDRALVVNVYFFLLSSWRRY